MSSTAPAIRTFVRPGLSLRLRVAAFALLAIPALSIITWRMVPPSQRQSPAPAAITAVSGHAYAFARGDVPRWAAVPPDSASTTSTLVMMENGVALGPGHTQHRTIVESGLGGYSHWGTGVIFSASDNTDPRTNGRRYEAVYRIAPAPWLLTSAIIVLLGAAALAFGTGAAWVLAAILGMSLLSGEFVAAFGRLDNGFGTAWAPYSDALGPWLHGGMAYLMGEPPSYILYRPSVGLFWGSIVAATGRIEMIAIFFTALLLILLVATPLVARDRAVRLAVVLASGLVALNFSRTWDLLHISSTNVDMPSMAMTTAGTLLILWGRDKTAHPALLAGCLCLGVAAAIRGPMLLAAPLMLAVRLRLIERPPLRIVIAAAAMFAAPVLIDLALQKSIGTINNGMAAVFCVYSDPTRTWSGPCHAMYLALKPTTFEVAANFLAFRLSEDGYFVFRHILGQRVYLDLRLLCAPDVLWLLAGAGVLAAVGRGTPGVASAQRFNVSPWITATAVVATLYFLQNRPSIWEATLWVGGAIVVAVALCLWEAVLCLIGYSAATTFLAAVGMPYERFQNTFTLLLYLGVAFLVVGRREAGQDARWAGARMQWPLPVATMAAIALLYVGSFLFPSELRSTYLQQVRGRDDAAIKISDDARIDRSLYMIGGRSLVYTHHDALPVGSIRKYRRLASPDTFNPSFIKPNAFID